MVTMIIIRFRSDRVVDARLLFEADFERDCDGNGVVLGDYGGEALAKGHGSGEEIGVM